MEYISASKMTAVAVLKALSTPTNLEKDILSDPDALIAEVAICNAVYLHYVCITNLIMHSWFKI